MRSHHGHAGHHDGSEGSGGSGNDKGEVVGDGAPSGQAQAMETREKAARRMDRPCASRGSDATCVRLIPIRRGTDPRGIAHPGGRCAVNSDP